ncbi:MAG: branched-chain amino acid ABC transporter permease [Desulfobacteraceae bacterium]|nr:branched-chain amino acid ABC transporter permease [Desulfobacteraceae bacterium]
MGRNRLRPAIGLTVLAIILIALPFIITRYYVDLTIVFFVHVVLAVSLRLITTTGDFSLAQVPLMGMGAYASALMSKYFGWPFWLTLPLAALASALVGLIMLYPLLRMKAFAFFIGSYAIGEALRLSWIRIGIFGGHRGISGIAHPSISIPGLPTISFAGAVPYYFLTLAIIIICLVIMYLLDKSRITNIFKAIHSEESLVRSVGINVTAYRILAFEVGTFFSGISGVLLAHYFGHIDPHQFNLTTGLYLLIWIVVGGYATFAGPIIGVAFFTVLGELMRPFGAWMPLVYGCILIASLLFLPDGLESLPRRISPMLKKMGIRGRMV